MLITPQSVLLLIRLFKFNNMKICHDISLKCWQQPMWIFLILSLSHWLISPEVTTVLGGFLFCFILFVILCLCIPTVVVYVYSLRLWLKEKKTSWHKHLREIRLILIRSCGREVLVAGAKAAGHIAPAVGTQRTMKAGPASCFLCSPGQTPAHGMALPTMMLGLTSSINPIR